MTDTDYAELVERLRAYNNRVESSTGKLWTLGGEAADAIEALQRDALRYRWLEGHFRIHSLHMDSQHSYAPMMAIARLRGPSLGAAIDAAIAAKGEK